MTIHIQFFKETLYNYFIKEETEDIFFKYGFILCIHQVLQQIKQYKMSRNKIKNITFIEYSEEDNQVRSGQVRSGQSV